MEAFFKSLRAIGDTLQDSRIGNYHELAGVPDLIDPTDHDVVTLRLIAQSDLQGGGSLAALWHELAERKQEQDYAAMVMGLPQAGATGAQAFQLAAMDEIERKRLSGHKPDTGGGGGDTSIYREGKAREKNLTPRPGDDGLSFRDSISNPYPKGKQPVFRPGHEYIEVDSSKLPPGSVIHDNVPPGHVTVKPTPLEADTKGFDKEREISSMTSSSQQLSGDPVEAFFAMLAEINESMMTVREMLASNPAVSTATRRCEVRRYGDGITDGERYDFETYVEATTHAGVTFAWWLGVTLRSSGWTLERDIEKHVEDWQESVREFDEPTFRNSIELTDRYSSLLAEFVESANNFDFNI